MEIIKYNTIAANEVEDDDYGNLDAMIAPVVSILFD
jgi:hypothetical protein